MTTANILQLAAQIAAPFPHWAVCSTERTIRDRSAFEHTTASLRREQRYRKLRRLAPHIGATVALAGVVAACLGVAP